MTELTVRGGVWTPGNHRHHHAVPNGDYFDTSRTTASGACSATAQPHEVGKTFQFWSWSGGTDVGTSTDPDITVALVPGAPSASLTRWYLRDSDVPGPNRPGVLFDAMSEVSGDFLDWGDTFDPFTVDPAGAREDCFASTANGSVIVTAAGSWPGSTEVFASWLVLSGSGAELREELTVAAGQSALAIACYADPRRPHQPVDERRPPYIWFEGDASPVARDLVLAANVNELAAGLADRAGAATVRAAVLNYVVERAQAAQKELANDLEG